MDVTEVAAAQAVAILNDIKAQYRIVLPNGATYGDLALPAPAEADKKPGGKRRFKDLYLEQVKNLKPGQEAVFDPADFGAPASTVRSLLKTAVNNYLGKSNAAVGDDGNTGKLKVMRYSVPGQPGLFNQ